ncbi:MAG: GGDEF domain-containing protein, partial [Candidatus Dormibacteraeota bacterium]|nr:GGDEF domain-containing protein [Candidatus Dormibacteraeota bacterium]
TQFWGTLAVSRVSGDGAEADHFIGMIDNISRRKARETDLEARALYDPLTGLPNRALLADRLDQAIADARRHRTGFSVIVMDLDGFKDVNDSLGHQAGDEVLIEVAARLKEVTRAADTVARLGGDEFVVVLPEAGSHAHAETSARKLLAVFETPVQLAGGGPAPIGCSLGCALFNRHGSDAQALLVQADSAMYRAKRAGSGFAFPESELEVARLPGRQEEMIKRREEE